MSEELEIGLRIVLPLVGAWLINIAISRLFDRERLRGKLHLVFIRSLVSVLVWAAGILVAISSHPGFSRGWETAVAGSGIAAVVLGLAAQEALGNVFAGISMSATHSRPFEIGDRVKIGEAEPGYVKDITLRHVVLVTFLNSVIIIPNSIVGKSMIVNYTAEDACGYPIEVQVAYGTDLDRAMKIMHDVILTHPKHYGEDNVRILCKESGSSGIVLKGVVTTKDFADNAIACSDCLAMTIRQFREAGIEIPYNKMEIIQKQQEPVI